MSSTHLAYHDLAINKYSVTDHNQDAKPFIPLNERKINLAFRDAPGDASELAN